MESGRSSYSTGNRLNTASLVRGRLGGGYLFTKDTPVLGRRNPPFSAHNQSPLATSSTGMNGSSNYLAPPQPHYQQLPQVCSLGEHTLYVFHFQHWNIFLIYLIQVLYIRIFTAIWMNNIIICLKFIFFFQFSLVSTNSVWQWIWITPTFQC